MHRPIAIIADDFTGAAEIAGISMRYGLTAEVFNHRVMPSAADIIVLNTDSRSMNRENASMATRRAMEQLNALAPQWIYKKTDSVLRGYVLDELQLQMELTGAHKLLFIPANPSLLRTIHNGQYLIAGQPISETAFAGDPEFPANRSSVLDMMGATNGLVRVRKHPDEIGHEKIVVGEASSKADIEAWVRRIDETWTMAGAADFYNTLLARQFRQTPAVSPALQLPQLYLSGTSYAERKSWIREKDRHTGCVCYLPVPAVVPAAWIIYLQNMLDRQHKAILAIDEHVAATLTAPDIREWSACVLQTALEKTGVSEIFIEGGSTAAAVFEKLQVTRLIAVDELSRGVVRMQAGDRFFIVKPGSYAMPEQMEALYAHPAP